MVGHTDLEPSNSQNPEFSGIRYVPPMRQES